MKKMDVVKFILFVAILAAAVWAAGHFHIIKSLHSLSGWIKANGFYGTAVYILIYGLGCSFGVPLIALTVFAASVFGTAAGLAVSSAGATLGITISFVLSRFLARDIVKDILGKKKMFLKIDALTEKYGWYLVAIMRFIHFIPSEFTNYAFGLTKIRFLPYIFWSWLCMLPWLFIYIAGTDAYLDYRVYGKIPWPLMAATAGMIALLAAAGIRFMAFVEKEFRKD